MSAFNPRRLVRWSVLVGLVVAAVSAAPASAAPAPCAGASALSSYSYKVTHLDGTTFVTGSLKFSQQVGRFRKGDKVEVTFTVKPTCAGTRLSLASYRTTESTGLTALQDQVLFGSDTGIFTAGPHTLTVSLFGAPALAGASGQCTQVPYAPGGSGANQPGVYDPTCDGSPSMNGNGNGNAKGKPCAGCVGKADAKNPPGQMPNGNDPNAGYECDTNSGVGQTNPAHTGCTGYQVDFVTGAVIQQLGAISGGPGTYAFDGRLIDHANGGI
jgi:hypothetical protein